MKRHKDYQQKLLFLQHILLICTPTRGSNTKKKKVFYKNFQNNFQNSSNFLSTCPVSFPCCGKIWWAVCRPRKEMWILQILCIQSRRHLQFLLFSRTLLSLRISMVWWTDDSLTPCSTVPSKEGLFFYHCLVCQDFASCPRLTNYSLKHTDS